VAAFTSLVGARAALAQVPSGAALAAASPGASGALRVWIVAQGSELDPAKLQASLAAELGREVTLVSDAGEAAVQIRVEGARALVHYTTASGEELARSVELPPDRQRSLEVVSWLTVNLVRDEATELLDELRARRKEEALAAETRAAAEKAAADKAVAEKAAADQAAAEDAARKKAEQAKEAATKAGGPPHQNKNDGLLRDPLKSYDLAVATPLSLLRDSPHRELKLQLALLYGDSGAIHGIATGPGVFRIRQDLLGVVVTPAAVLVGGNVRGVILATGFADVAGDLEGVEAGVGAAIHRGKRARGFVLAVGGAVASDVEGGVLGAGFASARSLRGLGMAAGVTFIRGPSEGVLIAGGLNATGRHRGVMMAGGVNWSGDLNGIALGPVNVQRRVRGLQFGIVNVADEVDGAAIGILSFAKNGRVQPVLWGSNDGSLHVGIKSTVGWAFTQIGAGLDIKDNKFSYDGGIGMHLKLSDTFFIEPGVHYSGIHDTADASGSLDEQQLHYLVQGGARVGDKLDFLIGGGLRHTFDGGSGAKVGPEGRLGIAFF
jgi:hypothetical protein